ncbi:complement C3 [Acridotheres tristis]
MGAPVLPLPHPHRPLLILLIFGLALLMATPARGKLVTMVTPAVLRLETDELVVLEAPGVATATEASLLVQDFPQKRQILFQTRVALSPDQGMMATATIKVPAKLLPPAPGKRFVTVTARVAEVTLQKVLLVALQSGHIFLQTDKPIYTPGATVLCRLFTVDHLMQPVAKTVIVEVKTPDNVIIKQVSLSSPRKTGILPLNHNLPEVVSLGMWTISAKFEDSPEQVFSTQFEVKEYVLPSFDVSLVPEEKFLYIDRQEDFRVSILARYLYGKHVDGTAFVLFGVMVDDEKKSIPQSLRRVQVQDGNAEAVLSMAHLRERFPNPQELVGHSLYVTVTVITESGSDMVEAQRGGIHIVTSPYSIHFTHTPKYFKPGMPFDLTVYVTNPDQSPAPRVTVQADGFQASVSTQHDGTARLALNMPANKDSVPITVRTAQAGLPRERQASRQMTAQAYRSQGGSGNFLHLAVAATELQPGDNLAVNFHLKTSNNNVRNSVPFFTYLIMSKGRILRAGRQRHEAGQSLVTMTLPVTPELIPSFRVVAYYYVLPGEIVADSVWVDVKDTCMGTLVVKGATEDDNRVKEPGTPMRLRIEGDHKAFVGLVAVDKGVFVISKKNKLTQSRVWDTVEKSDIGCTPGSGRDNIGVFTDAGLSLTTSVQITTPQRSDVQCPQPAKRKRRSLALAEYKGTKAAEYSDKLERKCCEDGMRDNPMGHSCDKRSEYIQEGDACVRAFLDCCRYIKAKRDQQNVSPSTGLARSKCWLTGEGLGALKPPSRGPMPPPPGQEEDDLFSPDSDIVSRSLFPESWLWQVEELEEPPNELGVSTKTLPVYLKDSITTWEVLAVSLSPSKGLCVASPYEIVVRKEFFIDLRLPYAVVRNEQVEIRAILYNYWLRDITVRWKLDVPDVPKGGSSWEERNARTYNIEGTSYALLALLQMGKSELAGPVVRWLAQQNYYGGGYGSTQATILVFQALAQYQVAAKAQQQLELDVSVLLPRRASPVKYRIENSNALVARSTETKLNEDFTVKAEGVGKGTMTVVTVYHAKVPEKDNKCDKFDLNVNVEEVDTGKEEEDVIRSVKITICTRYLDTVDATMSILDVSMLTGFSPDVQDLRRLSEGVDRYISKFELDQAKERSNVVIYLDKVSHKAEECFTFKAHQRFQVGLIQPAAVSVYSYYSIDDRCTRFYHPDKEGGKLNKICQGEVCRCAEESCFKQHEQPEDINVNQRIERACEPGVDFVYKVRMVAREETPSHDNYVMKVLTVIKMGTDENPEGSDRTFVSHRHCRDALRLRQGQEYLVWGQASDLWVTGRHFSYLIGKDTWLEEWPSEASCQDPALQVRCQDFIEFAESMTLFGCPS